jgi:hypothetical protein
MQSPYSLPAPLDYNYYPDDMRDYALEAVAMAHSRVPITAATRRVSLTQSTISRRLNQVFFAFLDSGLFSQKSRGGRFEFGLVHSDKHPVTGLMRLRMQSNRSRAFRRPLLSVSRFLNNGLTMTLVVVILAIGVIGLLILVWLEFTNPALLDRQGRDAQPRPPISQVSYMPPGTQVMALFS